MIMLDTNYDVQDEAVYIVMENKEVYLYNENLEEHGTDAPVRNSDVTD